MFQLSEPSWKGLRRRLPRLTSGRIRTQRRSFCRDAAAWNGLLDGRRSLKARFPTPPCSLSLLNQMKNR